MEKNKPKHDPQKDVHSEFETSVGNDFETVKEETLKKEQGKEGPLNQLTHEDSVKNEQNTDDEPPKMKADPDAL